MSSMQVVRQLRCKELPKSEPGGHGGRLVWIQTPLNRQRPKVRRPWTGQWSPSVSLLFSPSSLLSKSHSTAVSVVSSQSPTRLHITMKRVRTLPPLLHPASPRSQVYTTVRRKPSTAPDGLSSSEASPTSSKPKSNGSVLADVVHSARSGTLGRDGRTVLQGLTTMSEGQPMNDRELLLEHGPSTVSTLLSEDRTDTDIWMPDRRLDAPRSAVRLARWSRRGRNPHRSPSVLHPPLPFPANNRLPRCSGKTSPTHPSPSPVPARRTDRPTGPATTPGTQRSVKPVDRTREVFPPLGRNRPCCRSRSWCLIRC